MCRNGCEYSVVLQMAGLFVIHMALEVRLQDLRRRVCLCVDVCVSCASPTVLRMLLMLAPDRSSTFK